MLCKSSFLVVARRFQVNSGSGSTASPGIALFLQRTSFSAVADIGAGACRFFLRRLLGSSGHLARENVPFGTGMRLETLHYCAPLPEINRTEM